MIVRNISNCHTCGKPATGTFWVAYHDDPFTACVAEPSCEECGNDWVQEWDDKGKERPKGYWPGIMTDCVYEMSRHLTPAAPDLRPAAPQQSEGSKATSR